MVSLSGAFVPANCRTPLPSVSDASSRDEGGPHLHPFPDPRSYRCRAVAQGPFAPPEASFPETGCHAAAGR